MSDFFLQDWTTGFFSPAPLDAGDAEKKAFLQDPGKVGRPELLRKVSVDYDKMAEEDYWDPDWSGTDDDCPAFKEAKAKKTAHHPSGVGGSGSVAQRTKARRAMARSIPSGGVIVLDSDDAASQGTGSSGEGGGSAEPRDTRPVREASPVEAVPAVGTKRAAASSGEGPRLKRPQFRRGSAAP